MYIIPVITIIIAVVCFIVTMSREVKKQNDFEEGIREQWYKMTEEERKQSGRENMYC